MNTLILGGARSGKSRYAETQAQTLWEQSASEASRRGELILIVTGTAGDEEMAARIAKHQADRGEHWRVVEAPMLLADTLRKLDTRQQVGGQDTPSPIIVVDCLTLWMSNCMHAGIYEHERDALMAVLTEMSCDVFFVSNEVGSGVVPLGQLSRDFVDHSGWLHQSMATLCQGVFLVVAGLPLKLK